MKLRKGFVSNSSSSSFIIERKILSKEQIDMIRNHMEVASKTEEFAEDFKRASFEDCRWEIKESNDEILGGTDMDNFDMGFFLEKIVKIDPKNIKWEEDINMVNPILFKKLISEMDKKKGAKNED